ncbi:MAG TPA: DUF2726 domain-containing protein [Noviherbaspirillum sp.]
MSEFVVFVLVVAVGMLGWYVVKRERPARFRARAVVTGSALEFLFRLQRALPECAVCPQVAATALLEPLGVGQVRKAALARIVGRRVGFAVFDSEMQLLAVIELDHRPRLTRREAECEGYFSQAGIRTLRFHPKRMPSGEKIRSSVFPRETRVAPRRQQHELPETIDFQPGLPAWRNTLNANS